MHTQFTRPTKDKYIRIFGEEGEEVLSINAKSSAAVTYPNNALDRILTFGINISQLPVNHAFYVLFDEGNKSCGQLYAIIICTSM